MRASAMATRLRPGCGGERWVWGAQASRASKGGNQDGHGDEVGAGGPAGLAREGGGPDSGAGGTARTAGLGAGACLSVLYVVKTIAAATRETRRS
jgi:hypothetical protein